MGREVFLHLKIMSRRHLLAAGGQLLVLGAALLFFLVTSEMAMRSAHYEAWIPDAQRVLLVTENFLKEGGGSDETPHTPGPLAAMLTARFPDVVETAVRFVEEEAAVVTADGARLPLTVGLVDPAFIALLGRPVYAGDPHRLPAGPDELVLTRSTARRLFGERPAIGETVTLLRNGDRQAMRVVMVIDDLPAETHFAFAALMPISGNVGPDFPYFPDSWYSNHFRTFVKLRPGRGAQDLRRVLEKELPALIPPLTYGGRTYRLGEMAGFGAVPVTASAYGELVASPDSGWIAQGPARLIVVFALAVLGLAAINYGNAAVGIALAGARAAAVRKLLGAAPARLALAVLGVTALQLLAVLGAALILTPIAAAAAQRWIGIGGGAFVWSFVPVGAVATVFAGLVLVCGLFPAIFIARLRPADVLAGGGHGGAPVQVRFLRRLLLLVQFTIAAGLTATAFGIENQARFLIERPVGYEPQGLFAIPGTDTLTESQRAALLAEITRLPGVKGAARAGLSPLPGTINTFSFRNEAAGIEHDLPLAQVSGDFFSVLGIAIRAGTLPEGFRRPIANGFGRADLPIVINEAARRALGFASDTDAVGAAIALRRESLIPQRIVAVVADAELFGAFGARPVVFTPLIGYWENQILIRTDLPLAMLTARIAPIWERIVPDQMLRLESIAAYLARRAGTTRAEAHAALMLAVMMLLLALGGMLAIARLAFTEFAREAALRKLFGARALETATRFARRLLPPVLAANAVALPIAAWWLHYWLQRYPVRIAPEPALFFAVFALNLVVALVAIARPTLAAAHLRPVRVFAES